MVYVILLRHLFRNLTCFALQVTELLMRNRASVKKAQFSVHPAAKNYTFNRKMDDYNFFALSKYMKRQYALYYPFKDSSSSHSIY